MSHLGNQKKGYKGSIQELQGNPTVIERLHELGFIPGEEINIHGIALFGEPIFVQIRSAIVALRRAEASCIRL